MNIILCYRNEWGKNLGAKESIVEPVHTTTSHKRTIVIQNTKYFPVKTLWLEPLVINHLSQVTTIPLGGGFEFSAIFDLLWAIPLTPRARLLSVLMGNVPRYPENILNKTWAKHWSTHYRNLEIAYSFKK